MTTTMNSTIDPALIARIAREVIARLRQTSAISQASAVNQASASQATQTTKTAVSIDDKIITAASIEQLSGNPSEVFVNAKAIVTPAAKDAAKAEGITINRSVALPAAQVPNRTHDTQTQQSIIGERDLAAAVTTQLAKRGIKSLSTTIVLSETPGSDVYRYCSNGKRAVMIGAISEVDRFAAELNPDVWVLDTKRMNLIAMVNAAAMIAKK